MSKARKPNSMSPIRKALAAKTSLRTFHEIAVVDQEQIEEAQQGLDVARQLVTATLLSEDADVREKADTALREAKARRDACFHRIEFRGLPLEDFDALVQLHPATADQAKDPEHLPWNPDTFNFALLEAATVGSDLTAEDWKAELADGERWPGGEKARLINTCLQAQRQTMSDAAPKG